MWEHEVSPRNVSRSILLAVSILILLGSLVSVEASAYYSLLKESQITVSSPPVELQEGTAENCTGTIYANGTSAKVSVEPFGTGGTDVKDYVDNNTSNVDNSTDKGIQGNFTAQQYGPDLINDTLTEENATLNCEYVWVSGNDDFVRKLDKSDPGGTEILSWDTGTSYPFGCEFRIEDGNEYIYVVDYGLDALIKFHANNGTEVINWDISGYSGNAYGLAWNGSRWFIADGVKYFIYQADPDDPTVAERSFSYSGISVCEGLAWNGSYLWAVDSGTDKVYQIDIYGNIQTSWDFTPTDPNGIAYDTTSGHLWIVGRSPEYLYEYYTNGTEIDNWDLSGALPKGVAYASVNEHSYQLDLEVQWTNVDFDEPYELLCIYGGTMGAENITVDVWNGSGWENLVTDLNSGWNNVSVGSCLDSSTFTIRFKGGNETGDTTLDTWDIDAVLLHVCTGNEVLGNATTVSTDAKVRANSYGTQRAMLRTTDANNTLHVFLIDNSGYLQWYNSPDDGQTWNKPLTSTLSASSFSVEKDSSNDIHLVYESSGNVEYRKQAYNATAWGSAATLDSSGNAHQPSVVVAAYNPSWIYVVFDVHTTGGVKSNEVHFARSTDSGSTWAETSTDITGTLEYTSGHTAGTFASIVSNNTLGTYGHLYVTWFSGDQYLYLRRGVLGGAGGVTWDADDDVVTLSSAMSAVSTAINTNMMHSAMYVNGKYRVLYCESGTAKYRDWDESSWSSPISLATVSHYPSLTHDKNNYIYVFYQTNASNANCDIRYQKSADATPTGFGHAQNVTNDNNGNKYVNAKLGGDNNRVEFVWTYDTSAPYQVKYNYIGEGGGLGQSDFKYVLKFVEKDNSNWKVRLKAYDDSNRDRLGNCSIYIYDGSNSTQIVILNGLYDQQTGPWYDLNATDTEYIWMHVETLSGGTSYVYSYLEILVPDITTYAQYIITFEIT
jgi:hypothetical protein